MLNIICAIAIWWAAEAVYVVPTTPQVAEAATKINKMIETNSREYEAEHVKIIDRLSKDELRQLRLSIKQSKTYNDIALDTGTRFYARFYESLFAQIDDKLEELVYDCVVVSPAKIDLHGTEAAQVTWKWANGQKQSGTINHYSIDYCLNDNMTVAVKLYLKFRKSYVTREGKKILDIGWNVVKIEPADSK